MKLMVYRNSGLFELGSEKWNLPSKILRFVIPKQTNSRLLGCNSSIADEKCGSSIYICVRKKHYWWIIMGLNAIAAFRPLRIRVIEIPIWQLV